MKLLLLITGLLICYNLTGQYLVTGIVYDNEGNPLPGVNVTDFGSEPGELTNIKGKFSIVCHSETPTIYFQCYKYMQNAVIVDSTYFVLLEMEPKNKQYFKKFEDKKAGKLLKEISSQIKSQCFIDNPPGNLFGIKIELIDSSILKIYFKRLRHFEQTNKNHSWDLEKIRKEKIEMINHFIKLPDVD